jgi:hypothetical protein
MLQTRKQKYYFDSTTGHSSSKRIENVSVCIRLMGFIIAVTALTPEVGGASMDWEMK